MVVKSVVARARLAEPGSELAQARERAHAGDADWQEWVDEFTRGKATLIDMRVVVTVEGDNHVEETVAAEDHQVWMHLSQHPPHVAALVAELSVKDLALLSSRLRARGYDVSLAELDDMYVTVELSDDLLDALRPAQAGQATRLPVAARLGSVTQPE